MIGGVVSAGVGPACALIEMARQLASAGETDWRVLQAKASEYGINLQDESARKAMRLGGERHVTAPLSPVEEKLAAKKMNQAKVLAEVQETTTKQALLGIFRGGLLATLRGPQASLVGNTVGLFADAVSRVPSAMVDAALSLATGQRTVTTKGTITGLRAAGSRKAVTEAVKTFSQGANEVERAKLDLPQKLDYKKAGPVVRAVTLAFNKVYDMYAAADAPTRHGEIVRGLIEGATLDGLNKGLRGADLDKHVAELIGGEFLDPKTLIESVAQKSDDDPLNAVVRHALDRTDESLLSNTTPATRVASTISDAAPLIFPFAKVPTNAVAKGLEYNATGLVYGVGRAIQALATKDPVLQRKGATAIGRSLTGMGLMFAGYMLHKKGVLSEPSPDDKGERDVSDAAGIQGSSIRIGDQWYSVRDVPQAVPLLVGAMIARLEDQSRAEGKLADPASKVADATLKTTWRTANDLPTLKGMSDLVDTGKQISTMSERADEQGRSMADTLGQSRLVRGWGGMIIPGIVSDAMTANDDTRRSARSFAEQFVSDTPARASLPPQVDVLGRNLRRAAGVTSQVRNLSPNEGDRLRDPVAQEMYRLGVTMQTPGRITRADRPDRDLNEADYQSRVRAIGSEVRAALDDLIRSNYYKSLPDPEKRSEIEAEVRRSRTVANANIRGERSDRN